MINSTRAINAVRISLATALTTGLAVVGGAAAAPSAHAVALPTISSNSGGANLRQCASTSCGRIGYMLNGVRVGMLCWRDSQWVYPPSSNYASPRWFYVYAPTLRSDGWVHSSLVANQTSVPACPANL